MTIAAMTVMAMTVPAVEDVRDQARSQADRGARGDGPELGLEAVLEFVSGFRGRPHDCEYREGCHEYR
jgi:hypothetical protein